MWIKLYELPAEHPSTFSISYISSYFITVDPPLPKMIFCDLSKSYRGAFDIRPRLTAGRLFIYLTLFFSVSV